MYTKCPECNISFRVTAKVLQQANGNVRCGGCSHAFNALHYLSEDMPGDGSDTGANSDGDKLAETSRRLLKTLDELAGPSDVRIEDTGIEWRVLNEDEAEESVDSTEDGGQEEMRYDDSTKLPDDFGLDGKESHTPPEPARRETDQVEFRIDDEDHPQGDLALSEPEDWTDLLDEVRDPEPEADSLEVEEELAAIHSQLTPRDDPGADEATPADLDSQLNRQAEAMGLDITGAGSAFTDEETSLDATDIDSLLDDDDANAVDSTGNEVDAPLLGNSFDDSTDADAANDEETAGDPFAGQETERGWLYNEDDEDEDQDEDEDEDEYRNEYGEDIQAEDAASGGRESTAEFERQIDEAASDFAADGNDTDEHDETADGHDTAERKESVDEDETGVSDDTAPADDDLAAADADDEVGESDLLEDSGAVEHYVPDPTEEEMSVNMEIDREMMAFATQDDEFSATLFGVRNPADLFDQNADSVETIIMEGDFVRDAIEEERLAAGNAAKSQLDDPVNLSDTYATRSGKVRGGRRSYDPTGYGVWTAIIVLVLLLAGQVIHNSRQSLATIGLFDQTVAPLYRTMGMPVTPAWNIKGWQFETTSGNVDDGDTTLTIVSRIANRSDQALPYPLVHVSLTDRWEDIMGSRMLEPGEYLAGDLDPNRPVMPGEDFTAVIAIENPSADATGFKLNVCYRVSPGTVRCAIEDFKN